MPQEDFLKKQISKLSRVLDKIVSDLTILLNEGRLDEGIAITGQSLKNELDYDIEGLIALPSDELIRTLQGQKKLSIEHLDKLAGILLLIADDLTDSDPDNQKSQALYNKCLIIYEYLQTVDSTYSLDRHLKIQRIRNELSSASS